MRYLALARKTGDVNGREGEHLMAKMSRAMGGRWEGGDIVEWIREGAVECRYQERKGCGKDKTIISNFLER